MRWKIRIDDMDGGGWTDGQIIISPKVHSWISFDEDAHSDISKCYYIQGICLKNWRSKNKIANINGKFLYDITAFQRWRRKFSYKTKSLQVKAPLWMSTDDWCRLSLPNMVFVLLLSIQTDNMAGQTSE